MKAGVPVSQEGLRNENPVPTAATPSRLLGVGGGAEYRRIRGHQDIRHLQGNIN